VERVIFCSAWSSVQVLGIENIDKQFLFDVRLVIMMKDQIEF